MKQTKRYIRIRSYSIHVRHPGSGGGLLDGGKPPGGGSGPPDG